MVSFWWLFVALFFGMFLGADLAESGYLDRDYTGDIDE
jgi:hypothetical protein